MRKNKIMDRNKIEGKVKGLFLFCKCYFVQFTFVIRTPSEKNKAYFWLNGTDFPWMKTIRDIVISVHYMKMKLSALSHIISCNARLRLYKFPFTFLIYFSRCSLFFLWIFGSFPQQRWKNNTVIIRFRYLPV